MDLVYLTITGYKNNTFKNSDKIGSYKVMINPEKYTQQASIEFSEKQGQGSPGTTIKYKKTPPSTISFDLVFDATGVVKSQQKPYKNKVAKLKKEIKAFTDIVYTYNGHKHKPNYLMVRWGNGLEFRCMLTSMSTEYTLFRADGIPLRAKMAVTFKNYQSPKKIEEEAGDTSPDMTHLVTVVAGDNLPAMSEEIYGERSHYLKVARFNKLDNFRDLKPGTVLRFPPLI